MTFPSWGLGWIQNAQLDRGKLDNWSRGHSLSIFLDATAYTWNSILTRFRLKRQDYLTITFYCYENQGSIPKQCKSHHRIAPNPYNAYSLDHYGSTSCNLVCHLYQYHCAYVSQGLSRKRIPLSWLSWGYFNEKISGLIKGMCSVEICKGQRHPDMFSCGKLWLPSGQRGKGKWWIMSQFPGRAGTLQEDQKL